MAKADIPAAENRIQLNLLKLEYSRRFQLDVQLAFSLADQSITKKKRK